jgi:hypothetical protein
MINRIPAAPWLLCALLLGACGAGGHGTFIGALPPAPSTPTGLAASSITGSGVTLSWSAATDSGGPGIGGYYVFRNGNTTLPIAIVTTGTSYSDAILIPGTTYTYAIAAFDLTAPTPVLSGLSAPLSVTTTGAAPTNVLPVMVDTGPAGLVNTNRIAFNTLYATVTLCTPGSTTACQQIDHVQVDTGSAGLQIMAEVLNGAAAPQPLPDPGSGNPLRKCVQFADGYDWGSMVVADVQIAGRTLASLPVHLIGDPAAGSAPADCVSGPAVSTVARFGANGVLGIGSLLQDCGPACVTTALPASYYVCPGNLCSATTVALTDQLQNPIARFASDNNGVVISLPSVSAPSALSATGALYFGIGTQTDNALGAAQLLTVDPTSGTLTTTYAGVATAGSHIDSGASGYLVTDNSLAVCTHIYDSSFYCPATSAARTATIQGQNGVMKPVSFTVDNADQLFSIYAAAFPNLAGLNAGTGVTPGSFDWGLPFFFNRTVYVLFAGQTVSGTTGPAVGF